MFLKWLSTLLAKCYRFHSNIDYFLAVIRMKMKLGYSMFLSLEISKNSKFYEFLVFPWQHDDFKMAVFLLFFSCISDFRR